MTRILRLREQPGHPNRRQSCVSSALEGGCVVGEQLSPERPVGTVVATLRVDSQTPPQRREERAVEGKLASVRTAERGEGDSFSLLFTSLQVPAGRMTLLLSH